MMEAFEPGKRYFNQVSTGNLELYLSIKTGSILPDKSEVEMAERGLDAIAHDLKRRLRASAVE